MSHSQSTGRDCHVLFLSLSLLAALVFAAAPACGLNDKNQANSYDDTWQTAWVTHCQAVYAGGSGKVAGKVLQVGDSISHANPAHRWARMGQGRTFEDLAIVSWAHLAKWNTASDTDAAHESGAYLAGADTTSLRGMTTAGGMDTGEFLTGTGNGNTPMPSVTTSVSAARGTITNGTYDNDLHYKTLATAFADAEFAVIMLGTNDVSRGLSKSVTKSNLSSIIDEFERKNIVVILMVPPPRTDTAARTSAQQQTNAEIRALAQALQLPLIDMESECQTREIDKLLSTDGIHLSATNGAYNTTSDPYDVNAGGNANTHTTGLPAARVGYLLRSWLIVQKLKEIKAFVADGASAGLTVTATATPSSGGAPLYVQFTATVSGGTGPFVFSWDFGDGSFQSTLQNPTHTFNADGTYDVVVAATDVGAGNATTTTTVTVTVGTVTGGTLTLQQGLDGYTGVEDAHIISNLAGNNYGNYQEISIYGSLSSGERRSVIRFNDLAGVPASATIDSAILRVKVVNGFGNGTISAHRITLDWLESGVTWNEASAGTAWGALGGDFVATAASTYDAAALDQGNFIDLDVTYLVQGWVDGTVPNYGVLLRATGNLEHRIASSEGAAADSPMLVIQYSGTGGGDTTPPVIQWNEVVVAGSIDDATATLTTSDGTLTQIGLSFTWSVPVPPGGGGGPAALTVQDGAGNSQSRTLTLVP